MIKVSAENSSPYFPLANEELLLFGNISMVLQRQISLSCPPRPVRPAPAGFSLPVQTHHLRRLLWGGHSYQLTSRVSSGPLLLTLTVSSVMRSFSQPTSQGNFHLSPYYSLLLWPPGVLSGHPTTYHCIIPSPSTTAPLVIPPPPLCPIF